MEIMEKTKCPICNHIFEWQDASFCPYCGNNLNNTCTNDDCEMNTHNDSYEDGWSFPNDYKFCPECGSKTTYSELLPSDE